MSIKKMFLLVSSGLLFFLVAGVVINTMVVVRKQEKERVSSKITFEIHPDKMVSSYNFIEIQNIEENTEEEIHEETQAVVEEKTEEPVNVTTSTPAESSDSVYVGKMTGYGADCIGCNGIGSLSCRTADGSRHTLSENGEYYNDATYGTVRIVAAALEQFPCGTIVKVDHPILGTFYAVVMDTGGSMSNAWAKGTVWMDLAFKSESDPAIYSSTSDNTTYSVQRWGW